MKLSQLLALIQDKQKEKHVNLRVIANGNFVVGIIKGNISNDINPTIFFNNNSTVVVYLDKIKTVSINETEKALSLAVSYDEKEFNILLECYPQHKHYLIESS